MSKVPKCRNPAGEGVVHRLQKRNQSHEAAGKKIAGVVADFEDDDAGEARGKDQTCPYRLPIHRRIEMSTEQSILSRGGGGLTVLAAATAISRVGAICAIRPPRP